jgi:eukaryotic-like serine/threonine-protein kinase
VILRAPTVLSFPTLKSRNEPKCPILGRAANTKLPHHFAPQDYLTGRGDFRFAPPECLFAQASPDRKACKNADIYGLGSLLFELVTGQGITSLVLGYGPHIVRQALNQAASGRVIDLSSLRGKYADAFALFEQELPLAIRQPASALLRQLCDPVPDMRLPKVLGARSVVDGDLEWLLRRADILVKALMVPRKGHLKARRVVS